MIFFSLFYFDFVLSVLLIFNRIEIYSLRTVPKALAGKAQGWNSEWLTIIARISLCFFFLVDGKKLKHFFLVGEHLWPRSYGLTKAPSLTDLHNIHPADANGKRLRVVSH